MIEHRDPNCTGVWDKAQKEGVQSDLISRRTTKIFCNKCHRTYAWTHPRWVEALRENVAGYIGMNQSALGRRLLAEEREKRK